MIGFVIGTAATRCGPRLRRYARAFTYAGRDQLAYPAALLTRGLLLVIFVYVFNALWRAIAGDDGHLRGLTVVQLTWYLVFTEMVELARPSVMGEIQGQVQDGSIAYGLVRPYSYPLFALARAFGQAVTKAVPIGAAGAVVALALVGPLPGLAAALPLGLPLFAGALLLNCLWMLIIGLTAFWFESVMPFHWIHQKLVFIVGGMFFPLELLPPWLGSIAARLPFAFQAYWPARMLVDPAPDLFREALAGAALYAVGLAALAILLFRLGMRRVQAHGG